MSIASNIAAPGRLWGSQRGLVCGGGLWYSARHMTVSLNVTSRDASKKAAQLRKEGMIPGVVYGPKQEPVLVGIEKKVFDKVFKQAGESTVLELTGLAKPVEALVKEVAFDPMKGGIVHVDFYAIEQGKEITATIPLHFIGEAPASKLGAVLNKVLHEVEVTCMPAKLPSHIDVDVSVLQNIEDQLHVSDLIVPSGVKIEADADDVVIIAGAPAEEEVEPVAPVDMSAIEVEKKGKTEEEPEAV